MVYNKYDRFRKYRYFILKLISILLSNNPFPVIIERVDFKLFALNELIFSIVYKWKGIFLCKGFFLLPILVQNTESDICKPYKYFSQSGVFEKEFYFEKFVCFSKKVSELKKSALIRKTF